MGADIITNLVGVVGVAISGLSTNYSHTVTRELPCHLCDTPHAYELIQVHHVWRRRSVPVLGEDGKVTPFEVGKPIVINVLTTTNLAQLHHPHGMPIPVSAVREEVPISRAPVHPIDDAPANSGRASDVWADMQRLERFNPTAVGTLPMPPKAYAPRQRAYVVPPVVP